MPVEDVFTISGRGTVVTGRVERGIVKVGEEVEIVGLQDTTTKTVVTGVEMFRKLLDEGRAGDNIGALLRGIEARGRSSAARCWRSPGSITPHKKFKGEVYVLKKEEGGRHTPFFNGLPAAVLLPHDRRDRARARCPRASEMVMPGDNINMDDRAHHADRLRREAALRHPRGRQDRRRRRRHQDPRVTKSTGR